MDYILQRLVLQLLCSFLSLPHTHTLTRTFSDITKVKVFTSGLLSQTLKKGSRSYGGTDGNMDWKIDLLDYGGRGGG